jgi:hypothetical protein
MEKHYLLGEVAKLLHRKPYHVTHVLTTGKIPEPALRIGNKRLFTKADVERLAHHFRVAPDWSALDPALAEADTPASERLALRPPFEVASVGETCCEVRDGGGEVFACANDRAKALVLAGLLEAAVRS